MLLRKHAKKLQLGGALNQAKNEAAPMNITWKGFDLSEYKPTKMDIPAGAYKNTGSGSGGTSDDGLPSDVLYIDEQMERVRQKIKERLSGPNSAEYRDSAELKYDQEELNKWANVKGSMLKPRMTKYKDAAARLAKAKDDIAIAGEKALVMDNSDKTVKLVGIDEVVTARTKDGNSVKPRYSTLTVGDALSLRFEDKNFSGFTQSGAAVDSILDNVIDASAVDTEMDALFKKTGIINETESKFVTGSGEALDIQKLITDLNEAKQAYGTTNIKNSSNRANLEKAVGIFKENLSPGQLEALRNKAVVKFNKDFGTKDNIDPALASEWIDGWVNAYIADRASLFVRASTSKISKATGAAGGAGSSGPKREARMNEVTLNALAPTERVQLEQSYGDAEDLKENLNMMGNVYASKMNIDKFIDQDQAKTKKGGVPIGQSSFIRKMSSNLEQNLFLGDRNSTPVATLNGGRGLEMAVVDTSVGAEMKILVGMPYKEDEKGNYVIAWDEIENILKWSKKHKELSEAYREQLGVPWLNDDQKKEMATKASEATGVNMEALEKQGLKVGNIAMIPIVFADLRGFDTKLENVFSSAVSGKQDSLLDNITKPRRNEDVKKTFAFTVMPDSYQSTLPDFYGPAGVIENPVPIDQVIAAAKSAQHNSFNIMNEVLKYASVSPVKTEETK